MGARMHTRCPRHMFLPHHVDVNLFTLSSTLSLSLCIVNEYKKNSLFLRCGYITNMCVRALAKTRRAQYLRKGIF